MARCKKLVSFQHEFPCTAIGPQGAKSTHESLLFRRRFAFAESLTNVLLLLQTNKQFFACNYAAITIEFVAHPERIISRLRVSLICTLEPFGVACLIPPWTSKHDKDTKFQQNQIRPLESPLFFKCKRIFLSFSFFFYCFCLWESSFQYDGSWKLFDFFIFLSLSCSTSLLHMVYSTYRLFIYFVFFSLYLPFSYLSQVGEWWWRFGWADNML